MSNTPTLTELHTYALIPETAAEATLREHLQGALEDVQGDTGRTSAPAGLERKWREAVLLQSQRRLWPVLYPLDDGYAARERAWLRRYQGLVAALSAARDVDDDDGVPMMEAI